MQYPSAYHLLSLLSTTIFFLEWWSELQQYSMWSNRYFVKLQHNDPITLPMKASMPYAIFTILLTCVVTFRGLWTWTSRSFYSSTIFGTLLFTVHVLPIFDPKYITSYLWINCICQSSAYFPSDISPVAAENKLHLLRYHSTYNFYLISKFTNYIPLMFIYRLLIYTTNTKGHRIDLWGHDLLQTSTQKNILQPLPLPLPPITKPILDQNVQI